MFTLKPIKSLLIFLLFVNFSIKAQLTTSNALSPTQLVQTVLLGGGLTATNVTYNGDPTAIGSFGGTSNIGFATGLIMASGNITNAIGPNNTGSKTTSFYTSSSDPDLELIAADDLNDAAILEFDFVPTSDTIKFRYAFGSEEYMEFAGLLSFYNDVFGFFISGPNPAGGTYVNQNIALVPGTTTPVAILNVNLNVNSSYYFDNGCGGCFGGGTAPDGQTVQYDGFTVPLTATAAVICGQQYHIKLAISDVGDASYDSGVFIEGGSFESAGSTTLTSSTNFGGVLAGNDSLIYEGCGFASLLVTRTVDTAAQTFSYTLTGTAENGVDYDFVADTVHFAIGQDSAYVVINSLPDLLIEGDETVTMELLAVSACGGAVDTLRKTLYIIDTPPLKVSLNDDIALVCPTENLFLQAQTFGGVAIGGYSYTWTNAPATSTHDTLQINPVTTTSYIVTVSDSCGNIASDTCTVSFNSYTPMNLTLNNDTVICGGQSVLLQATVSNGLADYNYGWSPALTSADSITVTLNASSSYTLTITDACGYTVTDMVNITVHPISAGFDYSFATNQTVDFANLSQGAVSYHWNFGDHSDDSVSVLPAPQHYYAEDGTYTVTLVATNQNDCSDTTQLTLEVLPDFYFYFPNAFTPNKNGINDSYSGSGAGIKNYRMRIFNRWGQLVFESTDMTIGWDGNYKGKPALPDSYVCVFELEGYDGKKTKRMGNVTLVR